MSNFFKKIFRLDGIQDNELPDGSDWLLLSPMERLGVQSWEDAEIAKKLIENRKRHKSMTWNTSP